MAEDRGDLLAALAPITKALRRIEDVAAGRAGITMWQYAILSVVADAPGSNQTEVADRLLYSHNRIIPDLDLLEQASLLTRRPAADRRANHLELTAAGLRLMRRVRADIHSAEDELLAVLSPQQRHALRDSAAALSNALLTSGRRGPARRS